MPTPETHTHWYVLTGRPCSGITTAVNALGRQGYRTVGEAARSIIDAGVAAGKSVDEIRSDDAGFQRAIVRHKLESEAALPRDEVVFFDRAIPDNLIYHDIAGLDPGEVIPHCRPTRYRKVFFMEPLPYQADYARTESELILGRLERELPQAYLGLGYEVVSIPALRIEERVARILDEIG